MCVRRRPRRGAHGVLKKLDSVNAALRPLQHFADTINRSMVSPDPVPAPGGVGAGSSQALGDSSTRWPVVQE